MHNKIPALSVVIPVYNAEQYMEKCVKSVLRQKYPRIEIILVDDGSTDGSGELCDFYQKDNKNIKVLHTSNEGIIKARFAGAKISEGEWITFLDADDWIEENAYKDILEENDCDIIVTGICRYFNAERNIMQMPYLNEKIYNKKEILNEIVPIMLWNPRQGCWGLDPSLCTKIFKKELLLEQMEKACEVGSNYGEDSVIIFPMVFKAKRIQVLKKIYYFHRQRLSEAIAPYIEDGDFISKLHIVYEYLKKRFQETAYWPIMREQLDCFYIDAIELKKRCYSYPVLKFAPYFPMNKVPAYSKVVLYGAGVLGRQYWEQNSIYHFCEIVSWVDRNYKEIFTTNCVIEDPVCVKEKLFDYVIIAVDNYYVAKEISIYLKDLGISEKKIVWQSVRVSSEKSYGFKEG